MRNVWIVQWHGITPSSYGSFSCLTFSLSHPKWVRKLKCPHSTNLSHEIRIHFTVLRQARKNFEFSPLCSDMISNWILHSWCRSFFKSKFNMDYTYLYNLLYIVAKLYNKILYYFITRIVLSGCVWRLIQIVNFRFGFEACLNSLAFIPFKFQ